MGLWAAAYQQARDMFGLPRPFALELPEVHTFDTAPRPIDMVIAEMNSSAGARIGRAEALSVAAVQRGRNELVAISTLPLRLYKGLDLVDSPLLRQIDLDVPNVVTISATIEDLVFEGISWWQVIGTDFSGYPVSARHIDVGKVSLNPPARKEDPSHTPAGYSTPGKPSGRYVWVDGEPVPSSQMIRFDSPNPGLLKANARAIRRALLLDQLAAMFAENPQMREFFTDSDGNEAMTDEQISTFLAEYMAARRVRPVGWIPSTVKRADVNQPSPVDLQLVELQKQVTLEIANGIGVDPEDLGVGTTSRTYFNGVDRRQEKINRTYAPYMRAITDRLTMGDVTRRGYEVRFDLSEYLKSDPITQVGYWRELHAMGAMSTDEVRAAAGLSGPAPTTAPREPANPNTGARPPVKLGDITPHQFAAEEMHFSVSDFAVRAEPPKVDQESRTITGLAVPYNAVCSKYGMKMRFLPGSLEYDPKNLSQLKHLQNHAVPVGVHLAVDDTKDGPVVKLSVLGGVEGSPEKVARDQLLYDAKEGLYDGLSIGAEFSMHPEDGDVVFNEEDGVYDVVRATWRETSSTPLPSFTGARVTKVAASLSGGNPMDPCPHCGQRHAPGIACATFAAQLRTAPTDPTPHPAPTEPTPTNPPTDPGMAAFMTAWQQFQNRQLQNVPADLPTAVNPHRGPVQVNEPLPYRFDRNGELRAGSHDFSTDLRAAFRQDGSGDLAARDRAQSWVKAVFSGELNEFAVTPSNVAALNPNKNRPDLFVDQMEYEYPIYQAVNKGTLSDITPFTVPKFSSSSGLVADHTTGTEPTPGAYAATTQTISPTPVSGKIEITREAWDQGGNPQMSGLIWRQMVRAWYEALEAYSVAQLAANAASIPDLTITTAAADSTLDQSITDALVPLQYIRGGDRFRTVFTQIDLYKAMVKAKDSSGRRLYPQRDLGVQNSVGSVRPGYTGMEAHGKLWLPAWALAATGTVAASSYMFDPEKVALWATAPQRIDLEWRVAWVDVGLWGYKAFAITDFAGTREVIYDPV